ncbi:MAG: ammonium transporter [Oscillospiraceae bacterium]|nr:ammonium transporter [Oscillospiraceae bacterium]
MDVQQALNIVWTLIAGMLVFFMQAGFAMVETGFTRAKNAGNIIMKNLMDFSIGSFVFFVIGFGLMFGADWNGLIGTSGFFDPTSLELTAFKDLTPGTFVFFQTVFCATAATIVSGAMAERTKFISYVIYSAVISLFIYPVVGHWIWGGGWLSQMGFIDFAGSTVVHSIGGWAALIGAAILGPRIGKYNKDGSANAIPGHSLTLGALGVFFLWFGWFGFNPGSTLAANGEIGHIAMTTNLAAAVAACTVMVITWIRYKKPDVSMTLNGVLAGLVAITAGCQAVTLWGSIAIGFVSGFIVVFGVELLDKVLKIDDPVGAVAVHCMNGVWGTLAVGLFACYDVGGENEVLGLFFGGGAGQLGVQALGVVSVAAWTIVTTGALFLIIKKTIGLRVSKIEEIEGLDVHEHGAEAYADFVIKG